jgi:hypothetical protein
VGQRIKRIFVGSQRLHTLTFGLLTAFFFIRAGSLVSVPALIGTPFLFVALFAVKIGVKMIQMIPLVSRRGVVPSVLDSRPNASHPSKPSTPSWPSAATRPGLERGGGYGYFWTGEDTEWLEKTVSVPKVGQSHAGAMDARVPVVEEAEPGDHAERE